MAEFKGTLNDLTKEECEKLLSILENTFPQELDKAIQMLKDRIAELGE